MNRINLTSSGMRRFAPTLHVNFLAITVYIGGKQERSAMDYVQDRIYDDVIEKIQSEVSVTKDAIKDGVKICLLGRSGIT